MDRFVYAMINLDGECWIITDGGTEKISGLPQLLQQGWRPVRETPFYSTATSYILILLERDD